MATPAQITANRANALKSTGPRSESGKAASRFNALKHGLDAESLILPGEDPPNTGNSPKPTATPTSPDLPTRTSTSIRSSAPTGTNAASSASRPTSTHHPRRIGHPQPAAALLADTPATRLLTRIQRQLAAHDRAWYRALRELRRLREETAQAEERALDALLALPPLPRDLASFRYKPPAQPGPTPDAPPAPAAALSNPALRL